MGYLPAGCWDWGIGFAGVWGGFRSGRQRAGAKINVPFLPAGVSLTGSACQTVPHFASVNLTAKMGYF